VLLRSLLRLLLLPLLFLPLLGLLLALLFVLLFLLLLLPLLLRRLHAARRRGLRQGELPAQQGDGKTGAKTAEIKPFHETYILYAVDLVVSSSEVP
jgi:uncharacterized membrane protein YhaH (DUF805 family)